MPVVPYPRPDIIATKIIKKDECPKCYHYDIRPIKYIWWKHKMMWKCMNCKHKEYRIL